MSDLSTVPSGTSVHPGDRCLTTLWFLGARASRDTHLHRSGDPAYMPPTLLVVNDARGLEIYIYIYIYIYIHTFWEKIFRTEGEQTKIAGIQEFNKI